MANQILARLTRTMSSWLRIGNIQVKDSSGVVQFRNGGDTAFADSASNKVKIQGNNATNAVVLTVPNALGTTVTFTMPSAVGTTNQVLADTGGDGTLGFIDVSANANLLQQESFTEASSSPITIFTPPANARILRIMIDVSVAAAAGTPTISVGTAATPTAYMTTTENDLNAIGVYEVDEPYELGGSPSAVIATIAPDGQTFTGIIYVEYANPA